jgi:hypothetical protein
MVPLLALMVWMGSYPQTFMPAITSQNAVILQGIRKTSVAARAVPQEAR